MLTRGKLSHFIFVFQCIRLKWENSWEIMTVSIKRWCTPTWIKWTFRAKTLCLRCECSWRVSGSPERRKRSIASWRSLQQDILNAIRGAFTRQSVENAVLHAWLTLKFDVNKPSLFSGAIFQANPLCQRWHSIRPCLLNHYVDNRPSQSAGKQA